MRIVVQKFGGSSLANSIVRQHAAQRVRSAVENGYAPVVVVSAMGRKGDPYATDTLLELVQDNHLDVNKRNTDLLLSCGETISAVVFAGLLVNIGIDAIALTGWQTEIYTDESFGSARIEGIKATRIRQALDAG